MNRTVATTLFILGLATGLVACQHPAVAITDRALQSRDLNAYNEYLRDAAKVNIEREKAGLPPMKILTREEWSGKKQ